VDLKEEEILGDQIGEHWYYKSKSAAMLKALGAVQARTAIDVGSGSGFFARELLKRTSVVSIDCVDTSYPADLDEPPTAEGKQLRLRQSLDDAAEGVDLAVLMDVLEHVDDDEALLRAAAERVRPGGSVFVTVPAFQWLWRGHDEFLGHKRRYTLPEVEALVRQAGLVVVSGHYFFGLVLPAAAAQRSFDKLKGTPPGSKLAVYPPAVNRALGALAKMEVPLQHLNRVAGLSVFVRASRR